MRSFIRAFGSLCVLCMLVVGFAPSATAHGDISSTTPERDATVKKPPKTLSISFTETPAGGSNSLEVRDGCKEDVLADFDVNERTMTAALAGGRPGHWRISYQIVSAEDGHPSRGSYRFHVAGKPRCNAPADDKKPDDDGNDQAIDDDDDPSAADDEAAGDGLPWLVIGLGTIALVGVALLLRRSSGAQ